METEQREATITAEAKYIEQFGTEKLKANSNCFCERQTKRILMNSHQFDYTESNYVDIEKLQIAFKLCL